MAICLFEPMLHEIFLSDGESHAIPGEVVNLAKAENSELDQLDVYRRWATKAGLLNNGDELGVFSAAAA